MSRAKRPVRGKWKGGGRDPFRNHVLGVMKYPKPKPNPRMEPPEPEPDEDE